MDSGPGTPNPGFGVKFDSCRGCVWKVNRSGCRDCLENSTWATIRFDYDAFRVEDIISCPHCGLPADILDEYFLESTGGPLMHLKIKCVNKHIYNGPWWF